MAYDFCGFRGPLITKTTISILPEGLTTISSGGGTRHRVKARLEDFTCDPKLPLYTTTYEKSAATVASAVFCSVSLAELPAIYEMNPEWKG